MSTIAGLAGLDHPFAAAEQTFIVSNAFVAVVNPSGGCVAEARYALAACWCAAGSFLPFSWRDEVCLSMLNGLGSDDVRHVQSAVAMSRGQIELAFQIKRSGLRDPGSVAPSARGGASSSGRAYLQALRNAHDPCRDFVSRLRASAPQNRFSVSLVATSGKDASGLVRCAAKDAGATRCILESTADSMSAIRLTITGPLPPFGAGAEIAARLLLTKTRRAA